MQSLRPTIRDRLYLFLIDPHWVAINTGQFIETKRPSCFSAQLIIV
jgi:hypothetical protein